MEHSSFTSKQINEIRNFHINERKSLFYISKYFKCHEQTIRKVCVANNITVKHGLDLKFTNDDLRLIIDDYLVYKSISFLSKKYNLGPNSIRKILIKNNIQLLRKGFNISFPPEIEVKICENYKTGQTIKQITKAYKISYTNLQSIFKKYNLITRFTPKNKINQNYFKKINTFYKAYFLGLISADGCLLKNRKNDIHPARFSISLQSRDSYLLQKLSNEIGLLKKLRLVNKHGKRQHQHRISFADKEFCSNLVKMGCGSNKSFTLEFPTKVPKNLLHAYILGFFDGDGSITVHEKLKKGNFNIICPPKFAITLKQNLSKLSNSGGWILTTKCQNGILSQVRYSGNLQLLHIFHFLYRYSPFFLKRKYNKFLDLIRLNPKKYIEFMIKIDPYWKILYEQTKNYESNDIKW
jgi:hypothetical protein